MEKGEGNPFLKEENYYAGYQENIDKLKDKPEAMMWDKLCYLVFSTPDGKAFINEVKERFLLPGFVHPNNTNANYAAVYFEGFKEFGRMILNSIKSHEQRIQAQSVKE